MISQTLMGRIRDDLDFWETPVLWMYLDSVGIITVGCGTALEDDAFAAKVPFFHDTTKAPATGDEIRAAWAALRAESAAQSAAAANKKHVARFYENKSDLRITTDTSTGLRDRHVQDDYQSLQAIYPHFDDFPEDARLALFDMIYNLGGGHIARRGVRATGLRQYSHLNMAINRQDWAGAAGLCHRRGIPPERNAMTSTLFRRSVTGSAVPLPVLRHHAHQKAKRHNQHRTHLHTGAPRCSR